MNRIQEVYEKCWSVQRTATLLNISKMTVSRHLTKEQKERSIYQVLKKGKQILLYPNPKNFELNINGIIYKNKEALITLFDYSPKKIYVWRLAKAVNENWLDFSFNSIERDYRDRLVSMEFGGAKWINFTLYTNRQSKIEDLGASVGSKNSNPTKIMEDYISFWNEQCDGKFLLNKTISNSVDKIFWKQFSEEELNNFKKEISSLIPSVELYEDFLKNNFGGLIITNKCYEILRNVKSFDIKSAYGANFINKEFPVKPFKKSNSSIENLLKAGKPFYCCIINDKPLPFLKSNPQNLYYLTDIMVKEFKKIEFFNPITIFYVYESEYGKLNEVFTSKIKELYSKKEELKSSNIAASNLNKFMIQNIYGKSIQNIFRHGGDKKIVIKERYKTGRYLLPQWGVWSHDYTFSTLLSLCFKIKQHGCHIVATDTDCIRFIDTEDDRGEKIIEEFNKDITETSMGKIELEGIREFYCGRKTKTYCYVQNNTITLKMAGIDISDVEKWQSQFTIKEILKRFSEETELSIGGISEFRLEKNF